MYIVYLEHYMCVYSVLGALHACVHCTWSIFMHVYSVPGAFICMYIVYLEHLYVCVYSVPTWSIYMRVYSIPGVLHVCAQCT